MCLPDLQISFQPIAVLLEGNEHRRDVLQAEYKILTSRILKNSRECDPSHGDHFCKVHIGISADAAIWRQMHSMMYPQSLSVDTIIERDIFCFDTSHIGFDLMYWCLFFTQLLGPLKSWYHPR